MLHARGSCCMHTPAHAAQLLRREERSYESGVKGFKVVAHTTAASENARAIIGPSGRWLTSSGLKHLLTCHRVDFGALFQHGCFPLKMSTSRSAALLTTSMSTNSSETRANQSSLTLQAGICTTVSCRLVVLPAVVPCLISRHLV